MSDRFDYANLSNGLTIIGECDPSAHTASVGFFVKTGARDEAAATMGVSHFLEHMMFKGTTRRTAEQINREFDAMGAKSNAYTSSEMTVFYGSVLPDRLSQGLDVLQDMMRPALRQADFDTEKAVILEEIAMYEDDPAFRLYERAIEEHYAGHTLAYRVLGTKETITELKRDSMQAYFDQRYSADNTVVALSGKVDFDLAVKQIEASCGHWAKTGAVRQYVEPKLVAREFEMRDAKVSRAYRVMLSAGPSADDPRRYAAFVAAQLLGGSDNSRLHWALIETGLAEEADTAFEPKDGIGDIRTFLVCDPANLDEAWAAVEKEIAGVAETITAGDVSRVRAKVATGVTLAGEQPEGRMHRIGRQWLYSGNRRSLEEELEAIGRVSVEDVRRVIAEMPMGRGAARTIGTMLPA
jgi:predicted Zn-dependent peptidase